MQGKLILTKLLDYIRTSPILPREKQKQLKIAWLQTTEPRDELNGRGFHMGTHLWIELCLEASRRRPLPPLNQPASLIPIKKEERPSLSDVIAAWPALALEMLKVRKINSTLLAYHDSLRAETGWLMGHATTCEVMDEPAYCAPATSADGVPLGDGELWTMSAAAVVSCEIYDRYITRWTHMARMYKEEPCQPADIRRVPSKAPPGSATTLFDAAMSAPAKRYADEVKESIRRIKTAVLRFCCGAEQGMDRLIQYGSKNSAGRKGSETSFSQMEDAMCSVFRNAYRDACIVPGDVEWWNILHPQEVGSPSESVRKQHPEFDTELKAHLVSIGIDICVLQSRSFAGPVPGAQTVACTELFFQAVGSYLRSETECTGAAILWGAYVISYQNFFEQRDQLEQAPHIPMLLCGPGGMRCLWNGKIRTPPDPQDPWGPVGVWFSIARKMDSGCVEAPNDASCSLANGQIQLADFIHAVGPIWC